MKKKQPINLFINGQHTDENSQSTRTNETPLEEHAAALEPLTEDDLPVYKRNYNPRDIKRKKALFQYINVKSVFIAAGSAVVIGLCLGFFMLLVMGGFSDDQTGGGAAPMTDDAANQRNGGAADDNGKSNGAVFTLKPVEVLVLQAGVFSEAGNADTISEQFQQSGVATVKWNEDDRVYLFAGIAQTEEHAAAFVSRIAPLEVYVKEWTTGEANIDTDPQTKEWLGALQQEWRESFNISSEGELFNGQAWTSLGNGYPKQNERFDVLQETILQNDRLSEGTSFHEQQAFLLEIWKQLNQVIHSS